MQSKANADTTIRSQIFETAHEIMVLIIKVTSKGSR